MRSYSHLLKDGHTHSFTHSYHPKPPNDTLLFLLSMVLSLSPSPPLCLPFLLIVSGFYPLSLSLPLYLCVSTPLSRLSPPSSPLSLAPLAAVLAPHLSTYKYSHLCQTPAFASSNCPPPSLSLSSRCLLLPLMFLPLQFTAHTASKERERET